ncbi:MAG: competence/damage-inducible protein A [Bacteroidia bacterium]|nr:competence/damage-inducible protein A [Bacteroidia bacterium]
MSVEIITIGDELLIGQVVDTNSAWMAQELNKVGLKVRFITTVSDKEQEILDALQIAEKRAGIILMTGGLGPTKDDITKLTLCKYFKTGLRFDQATFENLVLLFKVRGREVTELNKKQAEVPENCIALHNQFGTAPGMLVELNDRIFISMPGVPHEMKGIMKSHVLPLVNERFMLPPVLHETILTQGIGESFLSELIAPWEDALPPHIRLAYLPSVGILRLRLSASGFKQEALKEELSIEIKKLEKLAGQYIFGRGTDTLEGLLGNLLREKKFTISTAESCTGGYLAHKITSIPGSSDYFMGSVVAYDNSLKTDFLNVEPAALEKFGAVSEEVVTEMARSVRKKFNTSYSIATSGIAGPGGATPDKPIGTVWIAIEGPNLSIARKFLLGTERMNTIHQTAQFSFHILCKVLQDKDYN